MERCVKFYILIYFIRLSPYDTNFQFDPNSGTRFPNLQYQPSLLLVIGLCIQSNYVHIEWHS
jgi:hypothetical protein